MVLFVNILNCYKGRRLKQGLIGCQCVPDFASDRFFSNQDFGSNSILSTQPKLHGFYGSAIAKFNTRIVILSLVSQIVNQGNIIQKITFRQMSPKTGYLINPLGSLVKQCIHQILIGHPPEMGRAQVPTTITTR